MNLVVIPATCRHLFIVVSGASAEVQQDFQFQRPVEAVVGGVTPGVRGSCDG